MKWSHVGISSSTTWGNLEEYEVITRSPLLLAHLDFSSRLSSGLWLGDISQKNFLNDIPHLKALRRMEETGGSPPTRYCHTHRYAHKYSNWAATKTNEWCTCSTGPLGRLVSSNGSTRTHSSLFPLIKWASHTSSKAFTNGFLLHS